MGVFPLGGGVAQKPLEEGGKNPKLELIGGQAMEKRYKRDSKYM